jgi:tetratricopeptide (TPR) repeat protein
VTTKEEYFGRGLALYGQHKHEEAITDLRKALELDPSFADAHLAIGHTLHKLNRFAEAVQSIQQAIALNPQEPMYHTSLSTVYRVMRMIPEAEEEMAIAFQLQRGQ